MANLTSILSDRETENWFKAYLALNITRSGLQEFVDKEIKNLHRNIYLSTLSMLHMPSTARCTSCFTANLLKCPTSGVCSRRGAHSACKSMHNTTAKLPRPCPMRLCDTVRDEIIQGHRYGRPSWRNTSAEHWASSHWEVAKCFMPPDGYSSVTCVQNTDFNGIISVMLNCKHFDNTFSFPVATTPTFVPCILTKARDIGRHVRHSPDCKISDAGLQACLTTLITLLGDSRHLSHDNCAQEAIWKIMELKNQTDLQISTFEKIAHEIAKEISTTGEMVLKSVLSKAEEIIQKVISNKTEVFSRNIDYQRTEHKRGVIYPNATKNNDIQPIQQTNKSDGEQPKHSLRDSSYECDVEDFLRRLKEFYCNTFMYMPISPLTPSCNKNVMDAYVDPLIHSIETNKFGEKTKRSQVLLYKDIFYNKDTINRRIVLQGEAGMGKSTFAAKLVLDWCNLSHSSSPTGQSTTFKDTETLRQYKFVFLVQLRDSFERDIMKMIKSQIIHMIYRGDERDKAYILIHLFFERERCLVLEDGLDEWIVKDSTVAVSFLRFANQSTVLITTRPWKLTDERIKCCHIDNIFEIEGISDPFEMSRLSLCGMVDTTEVEYKLQLFKEFVHTHEIYDLISSPATLSCLLCVWIDGFDEVKSLCGLYSILIDVFMKKVNGRQDYFQQSPVSCFSVSRYIKPENVFVQALSKAAFFILFSSERESSLYFDQRTLFNYISEQDLHFALKSGILSSRRKHEVIPSVHLMSFVHKSLQEFLAALYVATNVAVMDDCVGRYLQVFPDGLLGKSTFFVFLCGLNMQSANRLSCLIDDILDPQYYNAFQRIVISGFKEAKANRMTDSDINLKLSRFNIDTDCFEDYCILKQLCILNSHDVRELRLNATHTREMHSSSHKNESHIDLSLFQLASLYNIETLVIGASVTVLPNEFTELHKLKHLTLKCRCEGLDLSSCRSLETVEISSKMLFPADALKVLYELKSLTLHCMCLGLDLSTITSLETINISGQVVLVPNSLRRLDKLKNLTLNCVCEGLDLSSCYSLETIDIRGQMVILPNSLGRLEKLKNIKLDCVYEGLDFSSCYSLETIDISEQVVILPNSLRCLDKLKTIKLECLYEGWLDLSSCYSLETIDISGQMVILPNSLRCLDKLKTITLDCLCDGLDLSSCHSLETIDISGQVVLLPNAIAGLDKLKTITLDCLCDGLDLSACYTLETIDIRGQVVILPNAMAGLYKLKTITLDCRCDGLDLASCHSLETIDIGGQVILVPNSLNGLDKLKKITLESRYEWFDFSVFTNLDTLELGGEGNKIHTALTGLKKLTNLKLFCRCDLLDFSTCRYLQSIDIRGPICLIPYALELFDMLICLKLDCACDKLDLSQCVNLETVHITGQAIMVLNPLKGLERLKLLTLNCMCDGLDLSSCINLETVDISGNITLLPNGLPVKSKLKCLILDCTCKELDLSSCQNLETISIFGNIKLLPKALSELKKLINLTIHCKCDGLDLSSFQHLETLDIGRSVTLLPEVDSKLFKLNIDK
ncbi:uncharacterized protein LOC127836825 [Dreissena polymorpha]|uniref:NACHT domain-containing protein n=1 Tax=Dreissena polymorpha TaxID=45954 RepID=A0A9D4FAP4_DREPO|nr:uncharacterized protein LOC127836825 [Dreissena polymorpha]KAH3792347.1 hypothetical protein DPMN_145841 [Dreissena polymorpha]